MEHCTVCERKVNSCIIMGGKERYFVNSFPDIHQMPHHIHRAATKTRIDAAPNEIERHMDDAHEFVACVKPRAKIIVRLEGSVSYVCHHGGFKHKLLYKVDIGSGC